MLHCGACAKNSKGVVSGPLPERRELYFCPSSLGSAPVFASLLQAKDLLTNYQTGVLENSPKMVLLFHLIEESVKLGDKILVFR